MQCQHHSGIIQLGRLDILKRGGQCCYLDGRKLLGNHGHIVGGCLATVGNSNLCRANLAEIIGAFPAGGDGFGSAIIIVKRQHHSGIIQLGGLDVLKRGGHGGHLDRGQGLYGNLNREGRSLATVGHLDGLGAGGSLIAFQCVACYDLVCIVIVVSCDYHAGGIKGVAFDVLKLSGLGGHLDGLKLLGNHGHIVGGSLAAIGDSNLSRAYIAEIVGAFPAGGDGFRGVVIIVQCQHHSGIVQLGRFNIGQFGRLGGHRDGGQGLYGNLNREGRSLATVGHLDGLGAGGSLVALQGVVCYDLVCSIVVVGCDYHAGCIKGVAFDVLKLIRLGGYLDGLKLLGNDGHIVGGSFTAVSHQQFLRTCLGIIKAGYHILCHIQGKGHAVIVGHLQLAACYIQGILCFQVGQLIGRSGNCDALYGSYMVTTVTGGIIHIIVGVLLCCGNGGILIARIVANRTLLMLRTGHTAGFFLIHDPFVMMLAGSGDPFFLNDLLAQRTIGRVHAVCAAGCFLLHIFDGIVTDLHLKGSNLTAVVYHNGGRTGRIGDQVCRILLRNALGAIRVLQSCRAQPVHHRRCAGIVDRQLQTVQVKGLAFVIGDLSGRIGDLHAGDGLTAETGSYLHILCHFYLVVAVAADKCAVDKPTHKFIGIVGGCDQVDLFAVIVTAVCAGLRNRTVALDHQIQRRFERNSPCQGQRYRFTLSYILAAADHHILCLTNALDDIVHTGYDLCLAPVGLGIQGIREQELVVILGGQTLQNVIHTVKLHIYQLAQFLLGEDLNGSDLACQVLIPCCLSDAKHRGNTAHLKGNGIAVAGPPFTVCKAVFIVAGEALLGLKGFIIERYNRGSGDIYLCVLNIEDQVTGSHNAILQIIAPLIVGCIACALHQIDVKQNDIFIHREEIHAVDVIAHKLFVLRFAGQTHFTKRPQVQHGVEVCVGASGADAVKVRLQECFAKGIVDLKGVLLLYIVTEAENSIGNREGCGKDTKGGRADGSSKNLLQHLFCCHLAQFAQQVHIQIDILIEGIHIVFQLGDHQIHRLVCQGVCAKAHIGQIHNGGAHRQHHILDRLVQFLQQLLLQDIPQGMQDRRADFGIALLLQYRIVICFPLGFRNRLEESAYYVLNISENFAEASCFLINRQIVCHIYANADGIAHQIVVQLLQECFTALRTVNNCQFTPILQDAGAHIGNVLHRALAVTKGLYHTVLDNIDHTGDGFGIFRHQQVFRLADYTAVRQDRQNDRLDHLPFFFLGKYVKIKG